MYNVLVSILHIGNETNAKDELQPGNSKYGQHNTEVLSNVANNLYKFIDELLTSL